MADIDNVRAGGSIRDQIKQDAAARQQAQRAQQAAQQVEDDDDYYDEDVISDEDDGKEQSKLNIKFILVLIGGCALIALIAFMVVSGRKKNTEVIPEEPVLDEIPIDFEPVVEEETYEPTIMANYTSEQMDNLRSIGLTSEELERYMQNNVPYEYVYNTLMEQYWGWHLMNTLPTYDMTSDAYKDVIDQTWMALPERHDLDEWTTEYTAYSYDVEANLDYEKVTPYGNQLFLKIYLDDHEHDSWFFLNIKPEEWNMLGPAGNVVVNYTYQTHYKPYENIFDAEEDTTNIFITNASLNIIKSDFALNNNSSDDSSSN